MLSFCELCTELLAKNLAYYHWMLHCSQFIASATPHLGKILQRMVVTFVHHEQCEGRARKARTFFIPSLARSSPSLRIVSLTIGLITQFLMSASNYYNTLERKQREKLKTVNSLFPKCYISSVTYCYQLLFGPCQLECFLQMINFGALINRVLFGEHCREFSLSSTLDCIANCPQQKTAI